MHGAIRIARFRKEIPIFDFILELIDMGANTNLTDAENKTAFDIYMDQFSAFEMKKFSLKEWVEIDNFFDWCPSPRKIFFYFMKNY